MLLNRQASARAVTFKRGYNRGYKRTPTKIALMAFIAMLSLAGCNNTSSPDVESNSDNVQSVPVTVNVAPTAIDDNVAAAANSATTFNNLLDNDAANTANGTITIIAVSAPANGQVTFTSSSVTYTPNDNVSATNDSFTYTISNSNGLTDTATVTVMIGNATPTANDDTAGTTPGNSVLINVLDNDDSNTAGSLSFVGMPSDPANGTAVIENGQIRYTPDSSFTSGTDTFTYTVVNQDGEQATATVTVQVSAPPSAQPDSLSINKNSPLNTVEVLANDTDPDSTLSVNAVSTSQQGGKIRIADDGMSVTYEPPINYVGSDTFTYDVTDGATTVTETVTVTVNDFGPTQMQFRPCEAEADARKADGRPYCIDVGIPTGFDGHTVWATVFVPAAATLASNEKPPVILHAHGFGESRFASLENPNAFMRFRVTAQSLLELWHEGYWVISYDQRGFNASLLWGASAESSNFTSGEGCIMDGDPACIDVMSPEREARDATVVMDWITANLCSGFDDATPPDTFTPDTSGSTAPPASAGCLDGSPLYALDDPNVSGDPKLGTIGLSYGGGWQTMGTAVDKVLKDTTGIARTNDTRADAMVPVTTWHDLRYSLAPNTVPKSGWLAFLTTATNLGGTTIAFNGFLATVGAQANSDMVGADVYNGLYARSMRSYCTDPDQDGQGEGDDTLATDADLSPALGNGSLPTNESGAGPDVFIIQGQRDTLFNFNEAYDMAQCYQKTNPTADVRMLIQTEGHILPAAQQASYQDSVAGEPQVIYIDEKVFCDNASTPAELNTRTLISGWFREKLGAVDTTVTPLNADAMPRVCVNHFLTGAAPTSGYSIPLNGSLDDVIIGGSLTVTLDGDPSTPAADPVTFTLPTGAIGGFGADGITPPAPAFEQTLLVASADTEVVGIPTMQLEITANGTPGIKPPRFFVGLAVRRAGGALEVVADQVTPVSGEIFAAGPDCLTATACSQTYTYPRVDANGIGHGEAVGRLAGFGLKLLTNEELVLVIYDQHPLYVQHSSFPSVYSISLTGEVSVPVLP